MNQDPFVVGIPIYPNVDLLDVTAPCEMFSWMNSSWADREVVVCVVAESPYPVNTRANLPIVPHKTFDEAPQFDLLWTPGGGPVGLEKALNDQHYLDFLKIQAEKATWVTSVCEGALLLATAGLLDGKTATTHWAFIPCLKQFPKINVAEGFPRFVVDGHTVTGGGISSGLDECLELIKLISCTEVAEQVQLTTQYFPDPPVCAELSPAETCPVRIPPHQSPQVSVNKSQGVKC